jgi:hypothetical protein
MWSNSSSDLNLVLKLKLGTQNREKNRTKKGKKRREAVPRVGWNHLASTQLHRADSPDSHAHPVAPPRASAFIAYMWVPRCQPLSRRVRASALAGSWAHRVRRSSSPRGSMRLVRIWRGCWDPVGPCSFPQRLYRAAMALPIRYAGCIWPRT